MPVEAGSLETTRRLIPPEAAATGVASCAASGDPASDHVRANARAISATAGPRISMPVSRHGAMFRAGLPSHS